MELFKRKLSPDDIRDRVIDLIVPLTYIGQQIDLPYFFGADPNNENAEGYLNISELEIDKLLSGIEKEFKIKIPNRQRFASSTVGNLISALQYSVKLGLSSLI